MTQFSIRWILSLNRLSQKWGQVQMLLTVLLCTSGCARPAQDSERRKKIDALISGIPPISVVTSEDVLKTVQTSTERNSDGIQISCNSEVRGSTNTFESIVAFSANAGVLWPGALVQGKSLPDGILAPIGLPRAPATVVLNDLTVKRSGPGPKVADGQRRYSRTVENPNAATVREATQDLITQEMVGNTPARVSFYTKQFYSLEQALLQAGASVKWLTGSARGQLQSDDYNQTSNFVVRFVQEYYSLSYVPPEQPSAVFAKTVTPEDVQRNVGQDNPPTYVSSISYGRLLLLFASSNVTASQLKIALEAAFEAGTASGGANISADQKRVLQESELKVLVLGGGAPAAVEVLAGDKSSQLAQFLRTGANFDLKSPGVPIAYQVQYLKDNTVARLSYTTDYTKKTCGTPNYKKPATVRVQEFHISDTADDDEDMSFSITLELLRQDGTTAGVLQDSRRCFYVEEPGKVGNGAKNTFFQGISKQVNEAITNVKVRVSAETCDGDGYQWGTTEQVYGAPFQGTPYWLEGGNQGRWRLTFRID